MQTQIFAFLIALGLPGLDGAEDAGMLHRKNPLGWQWRAASLPESTPVGSDGEANLNIKPFTLSPIWVRLRKLVQEKSENSEHLLAQMTDENLKVLIDKGESFLPPKTATDPNAEGAIGETTTPQGEAPRSAAPQPAETAPAPKPMPPADDPNEGNTEKPAAAGSEAKPTVPKPQ